jgi:hypothetical protein
LPPETAQDYRGIPDSPQVIKAELPKPLDIWTDGDDAVALFGRMLPKRGRLKEYVGYYDAAFKSPEQLFELWKGRPGMFLDTAPTLATNLRAAGRVQEADRILRHADGIMQVPLRNGPPTMIDLAVLAYLRGAQGHDDEAVSLLGKAVAQGVLPDRMYHSTDIADEPCFARLVNRSDFQAIRQRIFARIDEERRKVPLNMLTQAYPVKRQLAA